MDEILKVQSARTQILLISLEVAKVTQKDNSTVIELTDEISKCMNKSERLLEKAKENIRRQREISDEMDKLTNKFNILAERAEQINQNIFPEQFYDTSTPFKNGNQHMNGDQYYNSLEVSPCPLAWFNGALESPMPPPTTVRQNQYQYRAAPVETQVPQIKLLKPSEMQTVPAYMKGRLTCENVNSFIGTLNFVLKQKYSITRLKRKDVKRKDLFQFSEWKSQEEEYRMMGKVFFTTEDLNNLGNFKIDKSADKMIQILRHTNRLRQTRGNGKVVLYVLI